MYNELWTFRLLGFWRCFLILLVYVLKSGFSFKQKDIRYKTQDYEIDYGGWVSPFPFSVLCNS